MKISPLSLIILLSAVLLFSACDKENHYSSGDLMVSYGMVERNTESADTSYIIHLDSGDLFVSDAKPRVWAELIDGNRVKVTFSPYEEKSDANNHKTYYGRINGIRSILYKNIVRLSTSNKDSIGNDPVSIRESWVTGDSILTVNFSFFTNGSVHYVNLVKTDEGNRIDLPYVFEFRHNSRGDTQNFRSPGIVSFNLSPFKIKGQHQTDFILRYKDYNGLKRDIPHTIIY